MKYIYCHPLFDERKCAHRFSYQLAEAFEKDNLQLERFDYHGTGEAEGAFSDVVMDSLRNDLQKKINGDKCCLTGTRFGATIAFDYCCRNKSDIQTLVLIEPLVNGRSYVDYLFRKQHLKDIMTGNSGESTDADGFCNLEGYKTNSKWVEETRQLDLVGMSDRAYVHNIFIVQVSNHSRIRPEYDQLADHLRKNGAHVTIEVFNLPFFWERVPDIDYSIAVQKISEWCR
jgi:alpha/beta superfamily hydrolase